MGGLVGGKKHYKISANHYVLVFFFVLIETSRHIEANIGQIRKSSESPENAAH